MLPPTAESRCGRPSRRRLPLVVASALVVATVAVMPLAAEPALTWTAAPGGGGAGAAALPAPVQEPSSAWPSGGQLPLTPLPPTQPRGPVVLDMPYEEAPSCPDECLPPGAGFPEGFDDLWAPRPWSWQIMPNNLIYTSYLAGPKEPRIGTSVYRDTAMDPMNPSIANGTLWDTTLGGRASILRYGSDPVLHPQGFEVQIEGAAFVRLDPQDERDLRSADYRFGVPLVYGIGRWQTKLAYYHNSAHLGDEAMLKIGRAHV